jgi:hypothetical protein
MSSYDDLAVRQQARFETYATAVAGERALASAAGLQPGSAKVFFRAREFKRALHEDTVADLTTYYREHLGSADELFQDRGMTRLAFAALRLDDIANQVMTKSNRDLAGKASLTSILRGGAGAVGLLAQQRLVQPAFEVKDTSGRHWDASKLVRIVVRDFAYQTYIDSQFDAALADGASEVFLEHADADHELQGASIDLSAADWIDQRDDLFHVNSNLTIRYGSVPA